MAFPALSREIIIDVQLVADDHCHEAEHRMLGLDAGNWTQSRVESDPECNGSLAYELSIHLILASFYEAEHTFSGFPVVLQQNHNKEA